MQYIAFDSHKHYTLARVDSERGELLGQRRLDHHPHVLRDFLIQWDRGSPVAVETIGNWYWIIDEIEAAGMLPRLVHARKAKLMMGSLNKTDKLDAQGLNRLQRTGTLPMVWIPPAELRDKRDLPRTRMVLVAQRTRLKNRIQGALARYGLSVLGPSDVFGVEGRRLLEQHVQRLPPQTRYSTERLLEQLDHVGDQIQALERRMKEVFLATEQIGLLKTLPGVGFILSVVIAVEVGEAGRFPGAEHLASYAGTTPRVQSSGGKTRYGKLRPDVNRYLKWAFIEAANIISSQRGRWQHRHVVRLYERLRQSKGHQKAAGAVARHLAEATYWILSKGEPYREPQSQDRFRSGRRKRGTLMSAQRSTK